MSDNDTTCSSTSTAAAAAPADEEHHNDRHDDTLETSPEICEAIGNASFDLLPPKSRAIYETSYKSFAEWRNSCGVQQITEPVMVEYFEKLAKQYKPSTLWAQYSMLKTTIRVHDKVDTNAYQSLSAFIKDQARNAQPQKAKVLTADDVRRFLNEAPNDQHLLTKVGVASVQVGGSTVKFLVDDVEL